MYGAPSSVIINSAITSEERPGYFNLYTKAAPSQSLEEIIRARPRAIRGAPSQSLSDVGDASKFTFWPIYLQIAFLSVLSGDLRSAIAHATVDAVGQCSVGG